MLCLIHHVVHMYINVLKKNFKKRGKKKRVKKKKIALGALGLLSNILLKNLFCVPSKTPKFFQKPSFQENTRRSIS